MICFCFADPGKEKGAQSRQSITCCRRPVRAHDQDMMRRVAIHISQVSKSSPSAGSRLDPIPRVRSSTAAQRRQLSTKASAVFGILLSSSFCPPSSAASLAFAPPGESVAGGRVVRNASPPFLESSAPCLLTVQLPSPNPPGLLPVASASASRRGLSQARGGE